MTPEICITTLKLSLSLIWTWGYVLHVSLNDYVIVWTRKITEWIKENICFVLFFSKEEQIKKLKVYKTLENIHPHVWHNVTLINDKKVSPYWFYKIIIWFVETWDNIWSLRVRYTTACTDTEWPHGVTVSHLLFIYASCPGSGLKKTVYIDSPLLKTEMTVRERSHIYHQESLKLSIKKNGDKHVFHVMTELPPSEQQVSPVRWRTDTWLPVCALHPSEQWLFTLCF